MERRTIVLKKKDRLLNELKKAGISKKILGAFEKIPREKFVLDDYINKAYDDIALPIIDKQTISQPSTIMFMLELLELKKGNKVLEIGAGSGYNAALMSCIVGKIGRVYSVETKENVYRFAKKNIKNLKLNNVNVIKADGSQGYMLKKPYDRIIVSAACPYFPDKLMEQVKYEGILVAPVGDLDSQKIIKARNGKYKIHYEESLYGFRFVPLIGKYGFNTIN